MRVPISLFVKYSEQARCKLVKSLVREPNKRAKTRQKAVRLQKLQAAQQPEQQPQESQPPAESTHIEVFNRELPQHVRNRMILDLQDERWSPKKS